MGTLNLLIANASKLFTDDDVAVLRLATKDAEAFITKNFDFDYSVDVVVTSPSSLMPTIPEDGISGRTYNSRLIVIVVDKNEAEIKQDIVFETICHEMSHSLRWEKVPEYAATLFQGMILEGLAVALEEEALADANAHNQQFFLTEIRSTTEDMAANILKELRDTLDDERYDYDTIFYSGNERLPRWAGYRLGYYLVKKHLQRNDASIYDATLASYKDFSL